MPTKKRRAKILGVSVEDLPDMRGRHKNHAKSEDHPKWNRGRLFDQHGYPLIRVGKHPFADPNGYIREHVLVYLSVDSPGEYLYRKYPEKYVIHHRNGKKTDNRYENLACIDRGEHNHEHNKEKTRNNESRFVGKKAAGRLLDGRTWEEYPK